MYPVLPSASRQWAHWLYFLSDVDDDGVVQGNIEWNFNHNGENAPTQFPVVACDRYVAKLCIRWRACCSHTTYLGYSMEPGKSVWIQVHYRIRHPALRKVRLDLSTLLQCINSNVLYLCFWYLIILMLFYSAYEALVKTIREIFALEPCVEEFLMCWNRRITQSQLFFEMMERAGFVTIAHGKGLYSFSRSSQSRVK